MPRVKTGFRVSTEQLKRKLRNVRSNVLASNFKRELMEFARKSLFTATQLTPARDIQTIRANQAIQYAHRINYIPSFHTLEDPSLIVNDAGEHWIYCDGKWFNGSWRLSDRVWAAYQDLMAERERRMNTNRQEFINRRAKSRFLYKRTWAQVAGSIGVSIPDTYAGARSRHNPAKEPPRGYGILRSGNRNISLDIRNPLLETKSRYKSFTGRQIIAAAMEKHRAAFEQATGKSMRAKAKESYK